MLHLLALIACAAAIYVSCEWFLNAIEWLGAKLKLGNLAVGTILAAIGTALPETVVTLMAVLVGSADHGDDIAIGAAMGGPLVVGTIAYAVAGAVLLRQSRRSPALAGSRHGATSHDLTPAGVDTTALARNQVWFLCIFAVKVGLGLVAFAIKPWLGLVFLAMYAVYFVKELTHHDQGASTVGLAPLKLQPRRADPTMAAICLQTATALVVIFVASQIFVRQLEWAGPALGLPTLVVALLLSPIATELPEIVNAAIWVRQGKPGLALGNISGAMMIQATIPSAIGVGFTSWDFDTAAILAGVATMASVAYLLQVMRHGTFTATKLLSAAGFYVVFAVGLVISL